MAQVTIYLPEDLIQEARAKAKAEDSSLSAWLADLVRRETAGHEWSRALVDLLTHGEGDLVEPDDPPPEEVEALS